MTTSTALITIDGDPIDYAIAAWLHSKTTRTGSSRTERAYRDTITRFRWALQSVGLDLDSDPARVADVAQSFCSRTWDPGRKGVSASSHNQRLAILSSFYSFARTRHLLQDNPISLVERRPVQGYAGAQPLDPQTVAERMGEIDRSALAGKRDFALLGIALFTGRRLSEIAQLRWGDVEWERGQAVIRFTGKGGKRFSDRLPISLSTALLDYVHAVHVTPQPDTLLWVALGNHGFGRPLSNQALGKIALRRLGTSKFHATRHTFAHTMESLGAKVSDIQSRLGHSNLATTGRYLAALRAADNAYGEALAEALGLTS
jgi:integrase